jgi:energy-coupling factor transporter ATP-binding protein EcfA2
MSMNNIFTKSLSKLLSHGSGLRHFQMPSSQSLDSISSLVDSIDSESSGSKAFHVSMSVVKDGVISPEAATARRTRDDGEPSNVVIISREGDFRDLKSLEAFRVINPYLLPAGVAGIVGSELTIHSFAEAVSSALSDSLNERLDEISDHEGMTSSLVWVLKFLGDAYRESGNHDLAWKDAWWAHVNFGLENLTSTLTRNYPTSDSRKESGWEFAFLLASFRLPRPDKQHSAYEKKHTGAAYAKRIKDGWMSGEDAHLSAFELQNSARFRGEIDADASHPIFGFGWSESFDSRSAELGHPVLAVSEFSSERNDHLSAWCGVTEQDFFEWKPRSSDLGLFFKNKEGDFHEEFHLPGSSPREYFLSCSEADIEPSSLILDLGARYLDVNLPWESLSDNDFSVRTNPQSLKISIEGLEQSSSGGTRLKARLSLKIQKKGKWREKPFKIVVSPKILDNGEPAFSGDLTLKIHIPKIGGAPNIYLAESKRGKKKGKMLYHSVPVYTFSPEQARIEYEPSSLDSSIAISSSVGYLDVLLISSEPLYRDKKELGGSVAFNGYETAMKIFEGISIVDQMDLSSGGSTVSISVVDAEERPLSPLIAAARGTIPTDNEDEAVQKELLFDLRGELEEWFSRFYSSRSVPNQRSNRLGQMVMYQNESRAPSPKEDITYDPASGLYFAGMPGWLTVDTRDDLTQAQAEKFWNAFDGLELGKISDDRDGLTSMWPSRLDLRGVSKDAIEAYIDAFLDVSSISEEKTSWSFYPFSVLIYTKDGKCSGVLLSPLHPIRLAWLWAAQKSFDEVFDQNQSYDSSGLLRFVDGSTFPTAGPDLLDGKLVSVPLSSGYDDLYVGWTFLFDVKKIEGGMAIPYKVSGFRFPVSALSGLTRGAVNAAILDYLRVFPYSTGLRVGLFAQNQVTRSSDLDLAIVSELDALLRNRGASLPGGVRVLDSENRLGSLHSRKEVLDRLVHAEEAMRASKETRAARVPFHWGKDNQQSSVDIRFMEDPLVKVSYEKTDDSQRTGTTTPYPLRRAFAWNRQEIESFSKSSFNAAMYSSKGGNIGGFLESLLRMETRNGELKTECKVLPGQGLADRKVRWIVAGNAYLDPQILSNTISQSSSVDKILWEWRPPYLPRRTSSNSAATSRPYTVVAKISDDFRRQVSTAMEDALGAEAHGKSDSLFAELGSRGIGISSLLSMGHQHSRGAVGFYLAFMLSRVWQDAATNDIRLVLPLDSINSIFEMFSASGTDERKRADLLYLHAYKKDGPEGGFNITFRPIEIKMHAATYSLHRFPDATSSEVRDAVSQLKNTRKVLNDYVSLLTQDSVPSLVLTSLLSLVETGLQLSISNPDSTSIQRDLLGAISDNKFSLSLQTCILFWFERNAQGDRGRPFLIKKPSGDAAYKIFLDSEELYYELMRGDVSSACIKEFLKVINHTSQGTPQSDPIDTAKHGVNQPVSLDNNSEEKQRDSAENVDGIQTPELMDPMRTMSESVGQTVRKMDDSVLDENLQKIIDKLDEFNVSVYAPEGVHPYIEGPSSVMYKVKAGPGVSMQRIESKDQDLSLALELDQDQSIRIFADKGSVVIDVPKDDEYRFYVSAESLWRNWKKEEEALSVPFAIDSMGGHVYLDFSSSSSPHLLIAGQTGSGKSEALKSILMGLAHQYSADELQLSLIDPKQVELGYFQGSPHLKSEIGYSADEAVQLLDEAVLEMESRYKQFKDLQVRSGDHNIPNIQSYNKKVSSSEKMKWWVIVLDEFADLINDDDRDAKIKIIGSVKRLSQKARAAGIHVIMATQNPLASTIDSTIKSNMPARLALQVQSSANSQVILDQGGAEKLIGKGDALFKTGGKTIRVQCAYLG